MEKILLHKPVSVPDISLQRGKGMGAKDITEITGQNVGPYTIQSSKSLTQGIAAVTNEVYDSFVTEQNHEGIVPVIIKIGKPAVEQRERTIVSPEGTLGGWLQGRLKNEALMTELIQKHGIPSPQILHYEGLTDGTEVLIEQKLSGQTCLALRESEMPGQDREHLEKLKGELLAKINRISVSDKLFGPLTENSMHFNTWQEYFNYKLSTTMSLLYGMYGNVSGLQHFSEIASSEQEWQRKIEHLAELFSAETVQDLIRQDGVPTVTHGDYWDTNIFADNDGGEWKASVIDLERGDISGKSFDLALWLEWKIGGDSNNPNPLDVSESFLQGYKDAGGTISPNIKALTTIYSLWQYLDFLILDTIYSIDRTDESAFEINKLTKQLEALIAKEPQLVVESVTAEHLQLCKNWLQSRGQLPLEESTRGKKTIEEVFGKSFGIAIDGLRLPAAPGFEGYSSTKDTELLLRANIRALKDAGVDGVVLETTFDRPHEIFYSSSEALDYYANLARIAKEEAGENLKVGLNLILFDLPASLAIAKASGLDFVVTDEFVEKILCPSEESHRASDFTFSPHADVIQQFRKEIGADGVLLFAGTHSNYYESSGGSFISDAARVAEKYGADALVFGKNNVSKFDGNIFGSSLPIFIAGGVKQDDLPWIKHAEYNGFLGGSIFEEQLTKVSTERAKEVMSLWDSI